MRKLIISITIFLLCLGTSSPVLAQNDRSVTLASGEIIGRTNFKIISDQPFKFPSQEEAAKVFTKGKEMLAKMAVEATVLDGISKKIDSGNKPSYLLYSNKTYKQDLKHYLNFYKQIIWKEDGTPDLTKAATAKAYLAFYYLIHNDGKPSALQVGRIDEHFPLLGVYADSFAELQRRFGNNDAYLWLMYELYYEKGVENMIPLEMANQARESVKEIFYTDLNKYGITQEEADKWLAFATSWKCFVTLFPDNTGGTVGIADKGNWYLTVFIRPNVDRYMSILHEFQHVKDWFPGLIQSRSLVELTTTLMEVVVSDTIRRKMQPNIPDAEILKYPHASESLGVNLGEIAIFFRSLSQKYNTDNYAQLLLLPEATEYIEKSYDKFLENFISKYQNINLDTKTEKEKEELRNSGKTLMHKVLKDAFQMQN